MDLFTFNTQFNLLICKTCKAACLLDEVCTHLRTKHPLLSTPERSALVQSVQQYPALRTQRDLEGLQLPAQSILPIAELEAPRPDGLQCLQCSYIACTVKPMQKHCRTAHGWQNPRRRGRQSRNAAEPVLQWRERVWCQRLARTRHGSSWFQVNTPTELAAAAGSGPSSASIQEQVLQAVNCQVAQFRSRMTASTIEEKASKEEVNSWLSRVDWTVHLQGLNREALRTTVSLDARIGWGELVDNLEYRICFLQKVWESTDRVVRQAQQQATARNVGLAVMFELAQKKEGPRPDTPFHANLEPRTLARYIQVWKKVMGFLIRTQEWAEGERPPYELTREQEDLFDQLDKLVSLAADTSSKAYQEQVDRVYLDLVVSLFDHQVQGQPYDNVVLSALAVLGIQEDGSWAKAEAYTGIYSAVIKLARFFVVRQTVLECGDDQQKKKRLFSAVRTKVQRFLSVVSSTTEPTPMDWIFSSLTYGLKIQHTTVISGKVVWESQQVKFQDVCFSMPQLAEMACRLSIELKRTMQELLFLSAQEAQPEVPWAAAVDDASNETLGYFFGSDGRNRWAAEGQTWVVRRILDGGPLQDEWVRQDSTGSQGQGSSAIRFQEQAVQAYEKRVASFLELLLVAMHLAGGQPARTTEILGIRHCNTAFGGARNIFIDRGMVCFVTLYHKGYEASKRVKVIHRYVPREIGESVVRYLWLVLPFRQQVLGLQRGSRASTSAFLWSYDAVLEAGEEAEADERVWSSDKMRRAVQKHSVRLLGTKLNVSAWRHLAVSISRRYLQGQFSEAYDLDLEDDEDGGEADDSIWDLQAAHSSHVAELVYGRLTAAGSSGTAARQDQFRQISMAWHRFLGLGAYDRDAGATKKRTRSLFEKGQETGRLWRLQKLGQVDVVGRTRQMLGRPELELRGNQQQVLQAIVRGVTPILQIASTGSGKSLSFMVPAYCSADGVTIVVVPLLALQADLAERCRAAQIETEVWEYENGRAAQVVLVTPESVVSKGFHDFVNRVAGRQQLDRIVVDECHTVLDSTSEFRPSVRQLGEVIGGFGVQLVFLTATLAVEDEDVFFGAMRVRRQDVQIFRSRTTRKNIAYEVVEVDRPEEVDEAAVRVVQEWAGKQDGGLGGKGVGKAIVYCRTVEGTEKMARRLGCFGFHNKAARKMEELGRWQSGQGGRVIAGTNALGLGLDVADVRLVVHAGAPYKLRDYVQESGRAGRDGAGSRAVVVFARGGRAMERRDSGMQELVGWAGGTATGCRRAVIDRVMDGRGGRVGCEEGEEKCDRCRRVGGGSEEEEGEWAGTGLGMRQAEWTRAVMRVRRMRVAEEVAEFERELEWWKKYCIVCWVCGKGRRVGHGQGRCREEKREKWREGRLTKARIEKEVWEGRKMEMFGGCFECGMAQVVCNRWVERADGGFVRAEGKGCQYLGVAVKVVAGVLSVAKERVEERVREERVREGIEGGLAGGVVKMLGEKVMWGEMETNWLCKVFWICSQIVQQS